MTVGNEIDAKNAVMGFGTFIGSGCDRKAYLINGIVYKVGHRISDDCVNRVEYTNYRSFTPNPAIRFPANNLIMVNGRSVMAMEYIEGDKVGDCFCVPGEAHFGCLSDIEKAMLDEIGFFDTAFGNVIRKGSFLYIVDFGE